MNKTDALIIGAWPTGLFTAHQLKLIGLNCEVVDNIDKIVARQNEIENLDRDTLSYVVEIMNELKLINLRNELLLKVLPLKV